MDSTTRTISTYACTSEYSSLPATTVHETKRRIIDALGCAMGAYHSGPAGIARRLASAVTSTLPSRLLGSGDATSPEMAAFANTVMVRYLDYNDTFVLPGGGHPSDMVPAVLALADPLHVSGRELIAAVVLAYEVSGALSEQVALAEKGWDQGTFLGIGAVCGAGKMLGLSEKQMGHAVSLAVVPNLPLSQTRVGELSPWKGCATAAANRNAVFAALLAKEGMEGPGEPFEGRHGLWAQATGPVRLGSFGGGSVPFKIDATSLKYYPSQIHTQLPISLALELRDRADPGQVESVELETYYSAWRSAGSDPEKWDPQTRETADHSLPYLIAAALTDGEVTTASFAPERVGDPHLRSLMGKITVTEDPELTLLYPGCQASRMTLTSVGGHRHLASGRYPKGHRENPISDSELEAKFNSLAQPVLGSQRCRAALDALWNLEDLEDVGRLHDHFLVTVG